MFDKKEYQEMFSRVTASQDTYRRVMTMSRTKRKNGAPLMRAALVAALIVMLAITVSASERVQNWDVLLSGIEMDHLTVSFIFANGEGMPDLILKLEDELVYPHVIMKDGSRIRLIPYGSDGSSTRNLLAEAPLVYEEIDHILMADGTVIPMPEMSK